MTCSLCKQPAIEELKKLVDKQAEDEGLWFIAQYASEAYLQEALREIHRLIEEKDEQMPIPWKIANEEYLVLRAIQNIFQRYDSVTDSDPYDDSMTIRQAIDHAIARVKEK